MERIDLALAQLIVYSGILKSDVFTAFRKWLFYLRKKGADALITQEYYSRLRYAILKTGLSDEEALLIITETNRIQRSFADMNHGEKAIVLD